MSSTGVVGGGVVPPGFGTGTITGGVSMGGGITGVPPPGGVKGGRCKIATFITWLPAAGCNTVTLKVMVVVPGNNSVKNTSNIPLLNVGVLCTPRLT